MRDQFQSILDFQKPRSTKWLISFWQDLRDANPAAIPPPACRKMATAAVSIYLPLKMDVVICASSHYKKTIRSKSIRCANRTRPYPLHLPSNALSVEVVND
ncbi:hypothetical protein GOB94_13565 [Granulicella sp. 5B5]|uniref:hypothetical protein n=1 Tax=Granulicella sp. 5B5 TaxID=1617967 RepID=UPI00175541AC|nr:hypothetical protein [Granulicella sp. 5B5]QMV19598.1 hypothetical protein GOB94_13565 [Granulicella sp. 5B5]